MFINPSPSNKIRFFHLFNHGALIAGLVLGEWWHWVVSVGVWYFIGSIGISIGYHRLLAHNSFSAKPWFINFAATVGCLATGGSPISWAGAHRMHHQGPDTEKDPHSPTQLGFWKTYLHLWRPLTIPRSVVRSFLKNRYLVWLHKNYFTLLSFWALFLYALGPRIGIFVYSVPAVMAFHAFGLINALGHTRGYTNYPLNDSSKNNWFVNLWTCGEGWHNNHHRYPSSYRIGLFPGEWDFSAFLIEHLSIKKRPLPTWPRELANKRPVRALEKR